MLSQCDYRISFPYRWADPGHLARCGLTPASTPAGPCRVIDRLLDERRCLGQLPPPVTLPGPQPASPTISADRDDATDAQRDPLGDPLATTRGW